MSDRQPPILWSDASAVETTEGIILRLPVELNDDQYIDAFNRLRRRAWTPADEKREWWPQFSEDRPTGRATRVLEIVVDCPSGDLKDWLTSNLPSVSDDVGKAIHTYNLDGVTRWIDDYELDRGWRRANL